jgi:two-component system, sensor histidine kinase PdtaS
MKTVRLPRDLREIQCWPLWIRLTITGLALGAAYLFQIPVEQDWPGEPFLVFLLVTIGATLCFGAGVGLVGGAVSTFLSCFFFEPIGSPMVRYASDLDKIALYGIVALFCVVGFAQLGNALINSSNADKNKSVLLRELVHGVANHFAAIAAFIQMKSDSLSDAEAKSVLHDALDQVKVMARVHRRLRAGDHDATLDSKVFIEELCDDLKASVGRSRAISIECKADCRPLGMDQAVTLGLIINELVTNAIKHAFPDQRPGRIRVEFAGLGDQSLLFVEDSGVGFDERGRVGNGDDLVKVLSRQLGGEPQVNSSKAGSSFRLFIPYDINGQKQRSRSLDRRICGAVQG